MKGIWAIIIGIVLAILIIVYVMYILDIREGRKNPLECNPNERECPERAFYPDSVY